MSNLHGTATAVSLPPLPPDAPSPKLHDLSRPSSSLLGDLGAVSGLPSYPDPFSCLLWVEQAAAARKQAGGTAHRRCSIQRPKVQTPLHTASYLPPPSRGSLRGPRRPWSSTLDSGRMSQKANYHNIYLVFIILLLLPQDISSTL